MYKTKLGLAAIFSALTIAGANPVMSLVNNEGDQIRTLKGIIVDTRFNKANTDGQINIRNKLLSRIFAVVKRETNYVNTLAYAT